MLTVAVDYVSAQFSCQHAFSVLLGNAGNFPCSGSALITSFYMKIYFDDLILTLSSFITIITVILVIWFPWAILWTQNDGKYVKNLVIGYK